MAHKDVVIDIRVVLTVPADDEYDEESYFADLRTHITDGGDNYLTQASAAFEEVEKIEVALVRRGHGS